MRSLLENGDTDTAHRLAHTIKGNAGTLGIKRLFETSKMLETALRGGDEIKPQLLKQFEEVVSDVMNTIAGINDDKPEEEIIRDETDIAALLPLLQELTELMEGGRFQAADLLPSIKRHLGRDLQPLYRQLKEQVEDYEFEDALETLKEIAKILNISCK